MIPAGKLNKRITITTPATLTVNEYGERTSSNTTIATAWASIEPVGARDMEIAKAFKSTVSHKITIRHHSDVDYGCSVTWNGRTFSVNGILNPNFDDSELILFATEVA